MGATAFQDRLNNLTLEEIVPKVVDTVNRSSLINMWVVSNPKPWNGRQIQQPIFINNSSQGKSFRGADTFDTNVDMNTVNLTWYATGFGQPVVDSLVERGANSGSAGIIEIQQASYEYAQNSMSNALGSIYYGTGTGDNFDGLNLIVDDSTSTSAYGGLLRSTYGTYINGYVSAASGGVLSLDLMDAADDASTVSGLQSETSAAVITTKTAWTLYASLLEPTKQAMYQTMGYPTASLTLPGEATRDGAQGHGGFTGVDYRGKTVFRDDKAPSGTMYFINPSYMEFRSLSIPSLKTVATANQVTEGVYDKVKPSAFQFRDYMQPVNQLAEIGIFVVYGNLIHRNPVRNAKITGITTV